MTTPETLAAVAAKINAHRAWGPSCPEESFERRAYMSLALCGEAGELANNIKKVWRGDPGDRHAQIVSELADVGNYAFMLASLLGVDLLTEMLRKLEEVEQRPVFNRNAKGTT
jgi:NTP pyrophosphatase (non-canonical NTP hydrolase)